LKCSTNPWNDTPAMVPSMSKLPGCVNVIPIDSSLDYQPTGPVPDAPTMPDPVDTLGIFSYCLDELDDCPSEACDSATSAWEADTSYVYNGESIQSHHLNADDYPNDEDYAAAQYIHVDLPRFSIQVIYPTERYLMID